MNAPARIFDRFKALDGLGDYREGKLRELVFNALRFSRMRVVRLHIEWAVELIGRERAALCSSLPANVRC